MSILLVRIILSIAIPTPRVKICDGFGISLAQFFNTEDEQALLTSEEKTFLHQWNTLSDENKQELNKYLLYLHSQQ